MSRRSIDRVGIDRSGLRSQVSAVWDLQHNLDQIKCCLKNKAENTRRQIMLGKTSRYVAWVQTFNRKKEDFRHEMGVQRKWLILKCWTYWLFSTFQAFYYNNKYHPLTVNEPQVGFNLNWLNFESEFLKTNSSCVQTANRKLLKGRFL